MLARHLAGYLPANLMAAAVAVGTIAVLTRVLTPEEFGWYALIFTIASLAHMATLTWVEAAANRFRAAAEAQGCEADHYAALLRLWGLASAAFAVVAALIVVFGPFEGPARTALIAALAGVIFRSGLKIALETRRAGGEVGRYVVIDMANQGLGFALGVAAVIAWKAGAAGPYVGLLAAGALCLALEAPMLLRRARGGAPQAARASSYFVYGAPLAFALCFDLLLAGSDRFVIEHYLGAAAVGAYAAGYQMALRPIEILMVWAETATTPHVIRAWESGGAEAARIAARQNLTFILGIGAPAAAGVALTAQPLADLLIGEAIRAEAAALTPWVAAAALLSCLTLHYFSIAFLLARKTFLRAALMLVPLAVNLGLNIALIPLYGLMGAVIATVAAYAVGMALIAKVGERYVALPVPIAIVGPILAATAFMALCVAALPDLGGLPELALKGGVGALAYGAAIVAFDLGGVRGWLLARLRARFGATA